MQLKNRLFFSIAYYLCKSSHFSVFVQNICAIWSYFHRISQPALMPHASPWVAFQQVNDLQAVFLFHTPVPNDAFLTSPALFFHVQALFCRKQACFDMRVPYVGTTMTRRGAFQNDSTPFVLLLKFLWDIMNLYRISLSLCPYSGVLSFRRVRCKKQIKAAHAL
jgi:hypothetical protein